MICMHAEDYELVTLSRSKDTCYSVTAVHKENYE